MMKGKVRCTCTYARKGTSNSLRIGYIDALKGFSGLCVVLGHVVSRYLDMGIYSGAEAPLHNIFNLLYSFHMPLFMMISGYVYDTAYFDGSGRPYGKRINRQVYDLIGVYVIFSVLRVFSKVLARMMLNREVVPANIALIAIKPIETLWYLYVLILFYLIFSIRRLSALNKWLLLGILTAAAVCGQLLNTGWFAANYLLYYALFFFIGMAYGKNKTWIIGNRLLASVLFCASVVLCARFWNGKYINQVLIVSIIAALGISLTLWYVFEHISFFGNCKIFKILGQYSLEIYVLHIFFIAGLTEVFLKVGIRNVYMSMFLNLAVSTAASVLVSEFCYKLGIHDLVFKPFTYLCARNSGVGKEQ